MPLGLDRSVQFLPGVGPQRAAALERLGIRSVEDLLLHLPRTYFDRTRCVALRDLVPASDACVRVQVETVASRRIAAGRRLVTLVVSDDTARLRVVWYNAGPRDMLRPGDRVLLAGPVVQHRDRLEMRQPEFERLEDDETAAAPLHGARLVPLYALTRGVTQKWLRTLMARALDAALPQVGEVLPETVRGTYPERAAALRSAHFPEDAPAAEQAHARFVFEELFFFQMLLARRQAALRAAGGGAPMLRARGLHGAYLASLPFALTQAQQRAIDEIVTDMESEAPMQRLLMGDVGAGKTVVAVAALLDAVGNGWQGAFMAPTETLAIQHGERLVGPCAALGVRLGLLIGALPERDKAQLRARMASGDVDLVVGTHALVQEGTEWARLGVAVVDEQQRFGVLQRSALVRGARRPHLLVMTATPIPRSLALTSFGDLDVSRLDVKPPGRQPVRTHLVPPEKRDDMLRFVRREIEAGRQAYVVLPIIDPSDKLELRAASEEFERLQTGPLAGLRLGLLHGRLASAEKEALMRDFRRGTIPLLVCTSVIEVGLDVGGATLMIVHHPERFGLSQLHQLRGRVGRGQDASWCFLLPGATAGDETLRRLREFAATEDGFRIAELDLQLRGPGDFFGTRQHGLPELRIADLTQNLDLLLEARRAAAAIVRQDPHLTRPEHAAMRAHLESRWGEREALASIL
jgi:ATP-dependent DNA helicase RecG